ncbi:hypothetical protein QIS99_31010 [Streptomyces sp. B-S-A8]|uniref:Integral membrane protein n=1 Tax=Streptomyces solicavernae TaxID=3043614 RepID=A0ABT6S1M3_9ACTN|nr:hypothetical protein [Streptomyces sp. B-S-A8]MDI3390591.1 hypothetical protein [Streptomyces sp. B-S-A8]
MARRPVALVAALVLVVEAVGLAWLNWFLGVVVDNQQMSLAGLDPHAMTVGSWVAGGLIGLYLLLCAGVLLRTGLRDRAPGGLGRTVLISAAVLHAVLGALSVGLAGWPAFAFLMAVLGLLVLTLVAYGEHAREEGEQGSDGTPTTAAANGPSPA